MVLAVYLGTLIVLILIITMPFIPINWNNTLVVITLELTPNSGSKIQTAYVKYASLAASAWWRSLFVCIFTIITSRTSIGHCGNSTLWLVANLELLSTPMTLLVQVAVLVNVHGNNLWVLVCIWTTGTLRTSFWLGIEKGTNTMVKQILDSLDQISC